MARPFQRPTRPSAWQRLKDWLEYWLGFWRIARHNSDLLRIFAGLAVICVLFVGIPLALCALIFFVFFLAGPLIAGFFFHLSHMEPAGYPIAEIIFALLFVLYGVFALLLTHRFRLGLTLNPPRRGLGLLISKGSVQFWQGTALCAIVAAQIALPAYAQDISILFWVVVGCLVLWPLLGLLFTTLLRGVRWLAHPRGMNE